MATNPQSQPTTDPNAAAPTSTAPAVVTFPYKSEVARLNRYNLNRSLFRGEHFDAFKIKVDSDNYNKAYAQLRYVVGNFAGLISKVSADMLFSEPPTIKTEDGDQDFLDALIFESQLETQLYESELSNSYNGDALFKIRIGESAPGAGDSTIIIETIDPSFYFPHLDPNNVRSEPLEKEIAYCIPIGEKVYLRKEIHTPGLIKNQLFLMDGDKIGGEAPLELLGIPGLLPEEETGIKRSLIVHVPNWKDGSQYYGYDDYTDLMSLFYALNNRMSKTENILDKHSDPILALPEGVLDEDGQVKREKFNMFEIPNDGVANPVKPEYIVWNANLDAAFKEVDKILDLMYMFSETSPAAFGVDKGGAKAESGRALKFRLMRTIHKIKRKRNYYDNGIKEMLYVAQLLAQVHKVSCMDKPLTKAPVIPDIEWQDGIPIDSFEQAQEEEIRLASGNTSLVDSIMRLDGVDEDAAEDKLEQIRKENQENNPIVVPVAAPTTGGPAGGDTTTAAKSGAQAAGSTAGRDIVTHKTAAAMNDQV